MENQNPSRDFSEGIFAYAEYGFANINGFIKEDLDYSEESNIIEEPWYKEWIDEGISG